jgi:hypothetical protein
MTGGAISTCKGLVNDRQKHAGRIGSMRIMAFSALQGFSSEPEVLLSEGCGLAVVTLLTKRSDVLGQ